MSKKRRMTKSNKHTAHNQSHKAHKKGIEKKPNRKHNNKTANSATEDKRMADLALKRSQLNAEEHDPEKSLIQTFKAMGLKDKILKGIEEYGYKKPPAVQRTVMPLYESFDVFSQVAEYEAGRTPAICLGILQKLDCASEEFQAIVLTANRASSVDIGKDMHKLGDSLGVKVYVLSDAKRSCPSGVHVVVGTPTCMKNWLNSREDPSWKEHIKVVFLDEPDRMSESEVCYIFSFLLPHRKESKDRKFCRVKHEYQVGVFSETSLGEVKGFVRDLMRNPKEFSVPWTPEREGMGRHHVVSVENADSKPQALVELFNSINKKPTVVFVDELEKDKRLVKKMNGIQVGWEVLFTGRDMNQKDRDQKEQQLLRAEGGPCVLITTEAWANGIDLKQVTLVVNYDLPRYDPGKYLRGMDRFGKGADAINLVTGNDWDRLFDIQEHFNNKFIFEGYPHLQPLGVGPAGFPKELQVEGLQNLNNKSLPEASEDIQQILFSCSDESKPDMIWNLMRGLAKTKSVAFAKVDRREELRSMGFNVFTIDELKNFLKSRLDSSILIIDADAEVSYDTYAKVPVVIHYDPPLALGLYNDRNDWCGRTLTSSHSGTLAVSSAYGGCRSGLGGCAAYCGHWKPTPNLIHH